MADLTAEPIPRVVDPVDQRGYGQGNGHSEKKRRPRRPVGQNEEEEEFLLVDDRVEPPHQLDIKA
ncbi:MAG: hypothetical protein HY234_08050 [Acidobacteria bacterium]|nr:hypothetical protein [Acidobacteriota bacterium]MBI3662983.1 hypothetical protein [Acidobacteriota bacterium]